MKVSITKYAKRKKRRERNRDIENAALFLEANSLVRRSLTDRWPYLIRIEKDRETKRWQRKGKSEKRMEKDGRKKEKDGKR